MSNTAEIFERADGYSVTAQNTDGEVYVDSISIEDTENVKNIIQEDGRTALDAEDGYEFFLEGEQLVGARVGYLHCVKEPEVYELEVSFQDSLTFDEKLQLNEDIPDTEEVKRTLGRLPPIYADIEYDNATNEWSVEQVWIEGEPYTLEPIDES